MNMQRCDECEKMGCPVEGMTGQCRYCGNVYCFGHLGIKSHNCEPKFKLDEYDEEVAKLNTK